MKIYRLSCNTKLYIMCILSGFPNACIRRFKPSINMGLRTIKPFSLLSFLIFSFSKIILKQKAKINSGKSLKFKIQLVGVTLRSYRHPSVYPSSQTSIIANTTCNFFPQLYFIRVKKTWFNLKFLRCLEALQYFCLCKISWSFNYSPT